MWKPRKSTRKGAETLLSHLKLNFLTKKSQKIQFKIERNFKSSQFARIRDFHPRLWGYMSFLAKKTKGNGNFDTIPQAKAQAYRVKSNFSFPSVFLAKNDVYPHRFMWKSQIRANLDDLKFLSILNWIFCGFLAKKLIFRCEISVSARFLVDFRDFQLI